MNLKYDFNDEYEELEYEADLNECRPIIRQIAERDKLDLECKIGEHFENIDDLVDCLIYDRYDLLEEYDEIKDFFYDSAMELFEERVEMDKEYKFINSDYNNQRM